MEITQQLLYFKSYIHQWGTVIRFGVETIIRPSV